MDPVLPLSPGRAERHGFEYHRHGTLSLYAALNTQTGEVLGRTASRHTSEEFVTFLQSVVDTQCSRRPGPDPTSMWAGARPTAFRAFGQQGQSWQAVDGVVTANPKSDTQSGNYVD